MSTKSLTPTQCSSCHKKKFESFETGHPEFSKQYPYFNRKLIKFDHISHLKKHFENPKFSDKAPSACLGCHMIAQSDREVPPGSYEVVCAACHEWQIKKKELILIRLPEFIENLIDRKSMVQTCNFPESQAQMEEEFLSISTEQPALINAFLLNIPTDDPESYDQTIQDLIFAMAEESSLPIAKLIAEQTEPEMSKKLLAGLNPEVLKQAACSWGLNLEYDPPTEAKFGGWYADMLEIRYQTAGHADPVAKSWVEFALAMSAKQDGEDRASRAVAMREQILSVKQGVGGCVKCHAVTEVKNPENGARLAVEWNYEKNDDRNYLRYKHDNHIKILGTKSSCEHCHIINKEVDYMASYEEYDPVNWVSNFKSIRKKTCNQCHSETHIRLECQECHTYHFKPSFKKDMLTVKSELPLAKP